VQEAQTNLGVLYDTGRGTEEDNAEAARWFREAASAGNKVAQYNLALMLDNGDGVPVNKAQAAALYRQAGEQGITLAFLPHARILDQLGKPAAAFAKYEQAAQAGSVEAFYILGVKLQIGSGVPVDLAAAQENIRKAADAGYPKAMQHLGVAMLKGELGMDINAEAGIALVEAAAQTGFIPAIIDLAMIYDTGNGVEQDRTKALGYLQTAAQMGDPVALNATGERLLMGVGTESDPQTAMEYFVAGIRAGSPMAMYNVGQIYQAGLGVEPNLEEAAKLYRAALDLGLRQAQDKLVVVCEGQTFPACFKR
jgi:hypothetical protein